MLCNDSFIICFDIFQRNRFNNLIWLLVIKYVFLLTVWAPVLSYHSKASSVSDLDLITKNISRNFLTRKLCPSAFSSDWPQMYSRW